MSARGAIALCCVAFALGMCAPAHAALTFGPTVTGGPEEVVYDYDCVFPAPPTGACAAGGGAGVNACNRLNYPDVPVKAFRYKNNSGAERVQITTGSNTQNRRLVGPSLGSVVPERLSSEELRLCGQDITFRAHTDQLDPSRYQGQEYITAPYAWTPPHSRARTLRTSAGRSSASSTRSFTAGPLPAISSATRLIHRPRRRTAG